MKRLISICMLIMTLLPLGCFAQQEYYTLQEIQEQAQSRWTQTYETKWRDITVDIQPGLPHVDQFPILEVTIDFWQPDTTLLGDGAIPYVADDGRFQVNNNEIREVVNAISSHESFSPPYDMNHAYCTNSDLTLGNIMSILEDIWVKLGQEATDIDYHKPLQFSSNGCYNEERKEYMFSDVFIVNVRQKLEGIPLLGHISKGIHKMKPQLDFGGGYLGNFNFVVSSPDLFYIVGVKMKRSSTISKDAPLCGYEQVKSTIEEEIDAGHIRHIFDIDLGYVLYNTPGMTNKIGFQKTAVFYAIPTWQVNCLYLDSGKAELRDDTLSAVDQRNTQDYKTVLIDAQTGKLISPSNNRKGCLDYQGFISWEDAGGNR